MRPSDELHSIEELRGRHEKLNEKRITAIANLKTSSETLDKLRKDAREKYGTDDVDFLRAQLEEMKRENERKREEYQEHLAAIEAQLADVESQHSEVAGKESPE
jgi:NADH dehydrogenase/NADH:ubiquinone oxidoreductase subunit G